MNAKSIKNLGKSLINFVKKNKSPIMVGVGICGMYGAIADAVRVTPVAHKRIEARKQELRVDKLPVMETIKTAGSCYLPTIVMSAVSTGCIIGGTSCNIRQNAALATAYTMSENALKEYKAAAAETIGEEKAREIQTVATEKKILSDSPTRNNIVVNDANTLWCYDTYTGRRFCASRDEIECAKNEVNHIINSDGTASLNDFHDRVGLGYSDLGDMMGWDFEDGLISISYDSILDEEFKPCLAISYEPRPKRIY